MANQKVNERGVSKLAEIWVKSTEVEGHEILPPLPAQNQTKIPSKLFFLYPMEWSGSPRNESIWTKYRNENIPIF